MDRLKRDKGADWVRVPFKGGGEAVSAILGGTTPIGLIGLGNVTAQIAAGKMTALALVNNIRTPQLPKVPTLADLGYKGPPSQTWYGLFAPAGTPKAIVDKLNSEIVRVVSDPDFQQNSSSAAVWCRRSARRRISPRNQDRPRRRQGHRQGKRARTAVAASHASVPCE